jgi:hypothetical protein
MQEAFLWGQKSLKIKKERSAQMFWLILWFLGFIGLITTKTLGFFGWPIFLGGLGTFIILFLLLIWYVLAPSNRWFTFVKEGTAKIVVKGDAFRDALIQWTGYTFDYENPNIWKKWNVEEENEMRTEPRHFLGGLRFYGFWPIVDIYIYRFKWSGVTEDGAVVHHSPEILDYILLKDDVYWAKVEQAEDKKLLPLDIELVLTVKILNPYKALFQVQNWLETIINRIKPTVRDIVTQTEYEEWIKNPAAMGDKIYEESEKKGLLSEYRDRYGVDVRKVQVKDINPPTDYREKTLAPYLAEMDKKAVVIKAEGESSRIERVFSQIQKFGDLGKLIRTLEAVEKSPLAASLTVQAIPGLQEVLRGIFGKVPETITPEELRRLREIIKAKTKKK